MTTIAEIAHRCVRESRGRTTSGPDDADVVAAIQEATAELAARLITIRDRHLHRLSGYPGKTCTLCGGKDGVHDNTYACGLLDDVLRDLT